MEAKLKPQDLRYGNYIYDDYKEVHKVEQVSSKDCKDWNKQPEVILSKINGLKGFYQSNDVFPIPLTEEWLLELGFQKKEKGYAKLTEMMEIFEISFGKHIEINRVSFNNQIKYVHQLQNLYFALTGEELTLTETP